VGLGLTENDGSDRGHVLRDGVGLGDNDGNLEGKSPSNAAEDLVADPFPAGGTDVKGVEQARSDGCNGGTGNSDGAGDTGLGDHDATDDSADGDGQNQGQVANARLNRGGVVDRLEVDRQVVDDDEVCSGKEEGVERADPNCSVAEQTGDDHGALAVIVLPAEEGDGNSHEADKEADDGCRVPRHGHASILKGQDVRDQTAHDQEGAERIHLEQLLRERRLNRLSGRGSFEEEHEDGSRDASDREVDVETPTPRDLVRESTSDQRPNNRSNAVRCTNDAGKHGTSRGRSGEGNDSVATGADSGGANTSDSTADDQSD